MFNHRRCCTTYLAGLGLPLGLGRVVRGCLVAANAGGELLWVRATFEFLQRAAGVVPCLLGDIGVVDRCLVAAGDLCNDEYGVPTILSIVLTFCAWNSDWSDMVNLCRCTLYTHSGCTP